MIPLLAMLLAAAPSMSETIRELGLEAFARAIVGARTSFDVAVAPIGGTSTDRERVAREALATLEALRVPGLAAISTDAPYERLEETARNDGAEWLLLIALPSFRAELREIDGGILGTKLGLVALASPLREAPAEPVARDGSVRRVELLRAPPLAVAACDLDGDGVDELASLDLEELVVRGPGSRRIAVSLAPFERASMGSRDPIGGIVCGAKGSLWFGASFLAKAREVRIDGERLVELEQRDGVPLGSVSAGEREERSVFLRAVGADGTNQIRVIELDDGARRWATLEPAVLGIVSDGARAIAVGAKGRLEAIDFGAPWPTDPNRPQPPRAPLELRSGRGFSIEPGTTRVVVTSSVAARGDHATLTTLEGRGATRRVSTEWPIVSSTFARTAGGPSVFLALRNATAGELLEVPAP
ncbi:MAG: hypothetical protein HYV07_20515 [Deltaproteobacteria bacterium]|nr:hypothetical protein [Deltaproteobacteria bacterium]